MTRVLISDAEPRTAESIAELERECFSDPWSAHSIGSCIGDGAYIVLAATEGESLCGYAAIMCACDEAEVLRVAVSPNFRRRGIASALLKFALSAAKSRGAAAAYLEVRDANNAAKLLYLSLGFETCGKRKNYYKNPADDAVMMRAELAGKDIFTSEETSSADFGN